MSDQVTQSYHGSDDAMVGKPVRRYQSVWMGHSMRTSCKSATQACGNMSIHYESKQEVHDPVKHPALSGPEIGTEIYAKGFAEVAKSKTVDIIDESLAAGSKRLRRESLGSQPFPMFNLSQKREGVVLALKKDETTCHGGVPSSQNGSKSGHITGSLHRSESHLPSESARAPPETGTLECRFQSGGISHYLEQQVKSHKDLDMNSLAASTSLHDDFTRSSLKIVPHGFNSRRTPLQPFVPRKEEIHKSNSIMTSKECVQDTNHCSHSTILVHEKKVSDLLDSRTCGKSLLRQKDATLLLHDPSTSSSNQQAHFLDKQWHNMQNHSGMGLFPSQSSPPEVTKSEDLYHGCHLLPRFPYSVHDVETMRIFTTINSIGGSPRSPSKFSQTTRHFMITEKTNVALSDKHQISRESTVSAKFKGKYFGELLSLSPDFRFQVQQGVKLQPLDSSTESDGQEYVKDVNVSVGLKTESSAETDTMDMDALRESHLPGLASSPSDKGLKGKSPTSRAADASAREEMRSIPVTRELCDINQALPDLPALASPVDCRETSPSRTKSLDVEHLLLSHVEQPGISKSSDCPDGHLGPEPSSRWVKRLKLSSCSSAHGTKSSKLEEASSHEKVKKFFSKVLKCGTTSSDPTMGRCHGKEQMALDQNAIFLRNGHPSTVDSVKKSQHVTLSNPWIRRWCHNSATSPRKTPKSVVVCQPQCSKATLDDFQKKQFPSVAAMALMGKAMRGFRSCEFRKRGSLIVWNSKGVLR
ncbi:uncharacterized protein LOC121254331 [Juglans microcarpa x Juglans regia]|uniref:uncharacterized protein LOC121254331 n=1 Tax=Juglans microcarpa x Juglans regia TaxID=2249226 RepID=UPI001B7E18E8|nr:uncharacterized protein LOC121254331 [Juglans microcarpa x Juglans regia]XP_041010259.1 uncharacterized protein LOC121254331 [Juglans microcarpa x Juglans regia]